MDREPIPDDIACFIQLNIPSVPYLEAILLLRREHRMAWDAKHAAQRLYLTEKAAQALLSELQAAGMAECIYGQARLYRYRPRSAELSQMIDRLERAYTSNLIGVTNLIHAKAHKKAWRFANAFRWKKDN
ncbi:MAG TPA: hypothetical protein VEC06_10660 [Paucimonas sp.]|nr:hypothetical protein [Paucimonas sp.]